MCHNEFMERFQERNGQVEGGMYGSNRGRLSKQDPVMVAFLPCPVGKDLLQAFASARPQDFCF